MKKITLLIVLFYCVCMNAQQPTLIKEVTTSLLPTGNSDQADLNYAKWNNKIFYAGTGSSTLCVTDGTSVGTVAISTLGGSTNISNIIPAQDFVYIVTKDVVFFPSISSVDKLWKSDGTASGTSLIYTFAPASGFTNVGVYYSVSGHNKNYSVDGNIMYFSEYDPAYGMELWKTDGTAAGTLMVKDINTGTSSGQQAGFCKIGTNIIFKSSSAGNPIKLWKTDGTDAGTTQIPVAEPFYIVNSDMVKLGNKVIFFAHNTVDGYEPYVSDGTAAGTFMLKNINPSGNSLLTQAQGLHLKIVGNYCYFIATDGVAAGLWRTDGTTVGTIQLNTESNNISDVGYSAVDSEKLWYINYNTTNSGASSKLIISDGTVAGTSVVHSTLSYPQNLTTYKGSVWMQARDIGGAANAEVWRSDGLQVNTNLALDVSSGGYSSNPFGFFELNGKLYFWGDYEFNNKKGLFQFNGDFTFNGSVNNDWNNKNNWNSTLTPISTDIVTIPSGFNVTTSANAYAKNISIASPINLNVGNLDIYGNATLSNSAKVTLNANNLNLKGKASSVAGNSTSYIVTNGIGKVAVDNVAVARGNVSLPIGTTTTYNPITILNTGESDTFSARVEPAIATGYTGETLGAAMTTNAVNATWFISEGSAGNSNATISLQWNVAQEMSGFDRFNAKMGHYNGTLWEGFSGSLSGSEPYVYTVNGVSTFSPFGILNNSMLHSNSAAIENFDITLYPNPSNGEFYINVSSELIGSKVSISNLLGQTIKTFELNSINTKENLSSGIYIISIEKDGNYKTEKIIIK